MRLDTDSLAPAEPNLREHHPRFHYRRSLAFWRVSEVFKVFNAFSQNAGSKNVLGQYNLAKNVLGQFFSQIFSPPKP